ncbi:MAG TPA: glutamyl-tRNA reductase [Gemmataceae bacterium]|nr:glutamyl-tRNA reductase [Gemmataceae bacterium]
MILLAVGCSHRNTPVAVRERLAFREDQLAAALDAVSTRLDCEAVILSTCNRVELYLARVLDRATRATTPLDADAVCGFLADFHGLPAADLRPHLYVHQNDAAVRHLFRVAASLDSLIVGEGQIAGQVKKAYEIGHRYSGPGPLLHALFPHARRVAKRVRTETGIAGGHASVSSAAVDYVRQVFDHFGDKTILVIGAGKMGELTLKHLRRLEPKRIFVANRSPEKAQAVARGCGGEAVPWERLDEMLARADIVLSTTGAPEPIVTQERYRRIAAQRIGGPIVILDIAVPRDFDPAIHDGDRTCLFNIDDLKRVQEAVLAVRRKHVGPAEALVEQETQRFLKEWRRRRHGPVIERLTQDLEAKREEVVRKLFEKINGRLNEEDRKYIEYAFVKLQNQFLHGPISTLTEDQQADAPGHTLLDALRKLFRLRE